MAEVTSITKKQAVPNPEVKVWIYRYTKAAAGDTLTTTGEFSVTDGVIARSASGATDDPATISANVITLTAGTGAGYAIVFGRGS